MKLFEQLLIQESQLSAEKEARHVIDVVNNIYNEWKKTGRRKNAVDIVMTTVNKLSNIDPTVIDNVHEATKLKLASLLVRCFDIPYWKHVEEKEKIYRKLLPLLKKLENHDPNTDTGGTVREVVFTRLAVSICYNSENKNIFVAYEPKLPDSYLRYLFGREVPERTYRMQCLTLPENFEILVKTLQADHAKAVKRFEDSKAN